METFNIGTKDDGSPLVHYHAPGEHVVLTGPATGVVTLPDGTEVDATPFALVFPTKEEAEAVGAAIDAATAASPEEAE